jgi:feruloyl esterase
MLASEIKAIDNTPVGDMTFQEALNATSADLSRFQGAGGKLVLYQGWADPLIPGYTAINYWQALKRADANGLTDYARLYMVPGMWHCDGGPGANVFGGQDQVPPPKPGDPTDDALAALIAWVENGVAPGQIIATKYVNDVPAEGIAFQRPLCPYPNHAAYSGTGDVNDPASFECLPNQPARIITPAPIYGP